MRFSGDPSLSPDTVRRQENIVVSCSCSGLAPVKSCAHMSIVHEDPAIINLVHDLMKGYTLAGWIQANEWNNPWRYILLGERNTARTTTWITIRNTVRNGGCVIQHLQDNIVPAIERRESPRLSGHLRFRLRCTQFPRSSANRGLCDHEAAVLWEAPGTENIEAEPG